MRVVGESQVAPRVHTQMVWAKARARFHPAGMKIEIYAGGALEKIRLACRSAAETLHFVCAQVRPGLTTAEIDRLVRAETQRRGATPSQLGYHGFPASVCTSRNDVVCHGIPCEADALTEGDILNIDVTSNLNGFHGDTSRMVRVGDVSPEAQHLLDVVARCLAAGIKQVRPGAHFGDIGFAISRLAQREGCSVVRDYGGHGIGAEMHMAPHVSHVGKRGEGLRMKAGMVFTIEPMVNLGGPEVRTDDDGWTVRTVDGSWSAQMEHTVCVTKDGVEVLTFGPDV